MTRLAPVLTPLDHDRISTIVQLARNSWRTFQPLLHTLGNALRAARIVPPNELPQDVISMNSTFDLKHVRDGTITRHALVYPESVSKPGDISILSPAGMALLSAAVGDRISWTDGQIFETVILEAIVYQPEAAGHFYR